MPRVPITEGREAVCEDQIVSDGTALAAYVPRIVREWSTGPDPEALRRRIDGSMVFVDISGFTKLSERLARLGKFGAEGVTEVIAACFGRLLDDAYGHGGTLLKFGGDALLLLYSGDQHARRAAASALDMRRSLNEVSRFDTEAGQVRLGMTVGVHTGSFDFFLVGGSHRELVIAGPAATELIDVEGSASTGNILVSAACAAQLPAANLGAERGRRRLLRGRLETATSAPIAFAVGDDVSRFVPRALAEAVRDRSALESEHRQVTIAFLYFKGIDQRIVDGGADAVAADLDQLLQIVQSAVDERGLCFLSSDVAGDGGKIILTAGAPSATGHDEEQMLLALRAITDASPAIPLRIGVNAGAVFAGEIGTLYRRNYTVMGDPVNLAARVMARAEPGQILATPAVLDRSRTLFDTTALEPFMVKGKSQPVTAYAVGPALGVRQLIGASDLPFVGRDAELAAWNGALSDARQGRGSCFELVAEPGAGKSRLLQAFLESGEDFSVHRAGCRLYQVDTPYVPAAEILASMLGLTGTTPAERILELRTLVDTNCPDLAPWVALIGIPLQLDIEPSDDVCRLDHAFRKERLESSVGRLIEALVTSPTIVCVEDTHWIDDASADLFASLAARVGTHPWILILTRRDQGPERLPSSPSIPLTRLDLAPLDSASAIELIDAATESDRLPRHVVEAMAQRCAGNPLFLLELLSAVRAGGDLDSLPTSVEALIGARIDGLLAPERDVLRRASVLGAGFRAEHLTAVLPEAEPTSALRRVADFVTVDGSGWASFRHALVRDVAYEGLPFRTRRQLHGSVADSIAAAETVPDEHAALRSLHLLHAHRHGDAWRCSLVAADRARRVFANLDAVALYERALVAARRLESVDVTRRAEVHELLGDVQDRAGLYDEAHGSYSTARRLVRDDLRRGAAVMLKEAYLAEQQGRYSHSLRIVRRGMRLLGDGDGDQELYAKFTVWEAAVRAMQGRFSEALSAAFRGIELSTAVGDEHSLARAYLIVDYAEINLGSSTGTANAATALDIYTRLDDLDGIANAANNLGVRHYYEGRWDDAAEEYERARDARQRLGDPVNAAFCAVNLAELLVEQGRLSEVEQSLGEALIVLESSGDRWGIAFATQVLGLAKVRAGELERGAELITAAQAIYVEIGAKSAALDADIALAEYHLLAGRPERAIELIDALIDEQRAQGGHEPQMPPAHRLRGSALVQLDDLAGAEHAVMVALASARDRRAGHEVGLALDALVALAETSGSALVSADLAERDEILSRLGIGQRSGLVLAARPR